MSSHLNIEQVKPIQYYRHLFKLCGFTNSDNFGLRYIWNYKNYYISLYAKDYGRAGQENKYDLPPPLDKELYY